MRRRKANDIWEGLYDFYWVEANRLQAIDGLKDPLLELIKRHKLPVIKKPTLYKHLLTHRQLYVHFFHVQATAAFIAEARPWLLQAGISDFTAAQTQALPKPILIDNFLQKEFYA